MARQVLPIVGAFVGAYFGNPQLGYAIGALVGNAVDPQHIQGPRLQELPVMGTTEGAYRQVVYGTCVVRNCQLLDWGPLEDVTVEERQGKGGGPVVESQRLYQTYAVGIGEPVEAIRYIKRNGIMVYDVRPGSTILAESAEFANRLRFYDGSETQLPDPDLEALPHNGVGNTPAYRGTSYFVIVRDDLTDLGGRIPTFEVECVKFGQVISGVTLATNRRLYDGDPSDLQTMQELPWGSDTPVADTLAVSPGGTYIAYGLAASPYLRIHKLDPETSTYSPLPTVDDIPPSEVGRIAWHPSGDYFAIRYNTGIALYERLGDTFTLTQALAQFIAISVAWSPDGTKFAASFDTATTLVSLYPFIGGQLQTPTSVESVRNQFGHTNIVFSADGLWLAGGGNQGVDVFDTGSVQIEHFDEVSTQFAQGGVCWSANDGYLYTLGGPDDDDNRLAVFTFNGAAIPGSGAIEFDNFPTVQPTGSTRMAISADGLWLVVAESDTQLRLYEANATGDQLTLAANQPPAAGGLFSDVMWTWGDPFVQVDSVSTTREFLVADICDRCGIPASKLDLSALTGEVRGITLGGPYNGAGTISVLMTGMFFDIFQPEEQIVAVNRGGPVQWTITEDDLLEYPDEGMLRGQEIEYPRELQLKYLDCDQNYAAPAAVVSRTSGDIRVTGTATIELPISMNRTEAVRVTDCALKTMWEDLNGEIAIAVPARRFAEMTAGDVIALTIRGAVYRLRAEKCLTADGQLDITASRDRQSTYTSNLTPIPLPPPADPPPSLAGATIFAAMNIPGIIDLDDLLGFRVAVSGLPGTAWRGANIAYSIDGGANWTALADVTRRAIMGTLLAPLPAASEFYTDTTNALHLQLVNDLDELEAVTQQQFLSESNAAAVVFPDGTAELVQFRDVEDLGDGEWRLTTLLRGRLATTAGPHLAGARFVLLDGSAFLPLPSALIGQTLLLRVTSLGTNPETAPIYTFAWNPAHSQTEFAPALLTLTRDGGTLTGAWSPRWRFGTDINPIRSVNCDGWRVSVTDGTVTETFDVALAEYPSFSRSDAAFTGAVTVTVAQLNRITGAGPSISETI